MGRSLLHLERLHISLAQRFQACAYKYIVSRTWGKYMKHPTSHPISLIQARWVHESSTSHFFPYDSRVVIFGFGVFVLFVLIWTLLVRIKCEEVFGFHVHVNKTQGFKTLEVVIFRFRRVKQYWRIIFLTSVLFSLLCPCFFEYA